MASSGAGGKDFSNPAEFLPYCAAVASLNVYDSGSTIRASDTVAFFTEMDRRGVQDTTDWTADTYKTLLSISSGKGLVAALVGPTAGGASTTTFRFTVDGVASTVAVAGLASGERATLMPMTAVGSDYTTAAVWPDPGAEGLDADKATFGAIRASSNIPPWRRMSEFPMLKFNTSLLIEAKHSASITNSTATAYSAVMYRKFLLA